jgi:hypothetical protein
MLLELGNIDHKRRNMLDNKELTSRPECRAILSKSSLEISQAAPACEILIYVLLRKCLPFRLTNVTTLSRLLCSTGTSESFERSLIGLPMRRTDAQRQPGRACSVWEGVHQYRRIRIRECY